MPLAHEQYGLNDRMNDEIDNDREIKNWMFYPRFSVQALQEPLVKGGFQWHVDWHWRKCSLHDDSNKWELTEAVLFSSAAQLFYKRHLFLFMLRH